MIYERYIASQAWRRLREQALDRDGHRCRLCDSPDALEVHHRRYPPRGRWDFDAVDALTTLCAECHEAVTSRQREKKYGRVALSVTDVVRCVPTVEVKNERLSQVAIQDHRRCTPVDAQRPVSGPIEPALTEHRRNYE